MDWSRANNIHGHSLAHEMHRDNSRVIEVSEMDTYDSISRPDFKFTDMFSEDIVRSSNRRYTGVRKKSTGRPVISMINKEFLVKHYIEEGMTVLDIAHIYNLNRTTIRRYMVKFGIPKHKAVVGKKR